MVMNVHGYAREMVQNEMLKPLGLRPRRWTVTLFQQLHCLLLNQINHRNIRRFWSMVQLFPLKNNLEFLVWPTIRCTLSPLTVGIRQWIQRTRDFFEMIVRYINVHLLLLLLLMKVRTSNNILKTLTGTTWGQQKETIILTYQAIGWSVIDYAAPVWAPVINESSWNCLQTAQNEALRIATWHIWTTYTRRLIYFQSNHILNY